MWFLLFKEAWISIFSNKLRSLLTILGVVIGVCAVILMVEVGQAVQLEIDKQLDGMGSNMMIITPASRSRGGVQAGRGGVPTLTISDASSLKNVKGIVNTAPVLIGNYQVSANGNNWNTTVQGSNTELQYITDRPVVEGDLFTERDVRIGTSLAVIGTTIKEKIFGNENPIGQDIKIKGIPFKIIGVLKPKGASPTGSDTDDIILVPLKAFKIRLTANSFPESVRMIFVKFDSPKNMKMIESRIYSLLAERHRIYNDDYDFEIINLTEIIQKISLIGTALSILLISVASISLLVGSIGIMNMMLTSVTERTKEIGIRKAIGAPNNSILFQFLVESILISFVGGFIGMVLGIVAGQVGGHIVGYEVPISVFTVVVSILVSIIVGILSGIIPARKATRFNPIDALRYQ
jgi:putative ABC transport system permease protein